MMTNNEHMENWKACQRIAEEIEEKYNRGCLDEYLSCEMLDHEFAIDSNRDYISCKIAITLGGPSIYINTRTATIDLYSASDIVSYMLDRDVSDYIDSIFEEIYNS